MEKNIKKSAEQIQTFSGRRFKKVLKASGVKARQLARRIGTNDAMIWKYASDHVMPRQDRIEEMAAVLGVEPDAFAMPVGGNDEHFDDRMINRYSIEERRFIRFFVNCPRPRQESLFSLFEGILIAANTDGK